MTADTFKRTRHSLESIVYYKTHHSWAGKNFLNRSSQTAGKRYFEFSFANTVNNAFQLCVLFSDAPKQFPLGGGGFDQLINYFY